MKTLVLLFVSLSLECCLPHIVWRDPDAGGDDDVPDLDVVLVLADGGTDTSETSSVDAAIDVAATDVVAADDQTTDTVDGLNVDVFTPPDTPDEGVRCSSNPCGSSEDCIDSVGSVLCCVGNGSGCTDFACCPAGLNCRGFTCDQCCRTIR